jgi:hypothetical protein
VGRLAGSCGSADQINEMVWHVLDLWLSSLRWKRDHFGAHPHPAWQKTDAGASGFGS